MTKTEQTERDKLSLILSVALICLISAAMIPTVMAASTVDLGTAGDYAILSKSGITTTGTTMVTGDMGVSPIAATAITGFSLIIDPSNTFSTSPLVVGKIYAANYADPTPAKLTTAVSNMETAYADAAGRSPDYTELYSGNLGGKTLTPGTYKYSTSVTIPTDLTLDAQGNSGSVWIFQIAQNLDIAANKQVILSNGADPNNIFWKVTGTTTLYAGSVFHGNILGASTIALIDGATLNGRALGQKEVILIANPVTAIATPVREKIPETPEYPGFQWIYILMIIGVMSVVASIAYHFTMRTRAEKRR
ncbi:ice-binding family protein [Methanocalculus sp.]|uniref:ice-binding family protein n=1 Tax=Methanocalculus sp. TaxID=2004547 RepID=UPI002723F945|nr:ice-binding family protein [Methanocalculus sp.]MDO8841455.1 ice-binding family protein [Methanocalculus sp.]